MIEETKWPEGKWFEECPMEIYIYSKQQDPGSSVVQEMVQKLDGTIEYVRLVSVGDSEEN